MRWTVLILTGSIPDNRARASSIAQRTKYQPYHNYAGEHSYTALISKFVNKQGFKRLWDDAAKAPYLWNADSATFITYNDPESLKEKAEFVKLHHLGGIVYWEHNHDPAEILLSTIFEQLR